MFCGGVSEKATAERFALISQIEDRSNESIEDEKQNNVN